MQKILVSGSVNGSISKVYGRVTKLQQKAGNFDLLICCGEFFNAQNKDEFSEYVSGQRTIPVQTYILGPNSSEVAEFFGSSANGGGELCKNLFVFGKSGIYKMSGGLTVAYLSGTHGTNDSNYTDDDVRTLIGKLQRNIQDTGFGCDILITYDWPLGVARFTNAPSDDVANPKSGCSRLVSVLAANAKPQYHFTGGRDVHYERAPYRNHRQFEHVSAREKVATRFIALGNYAEPQAAKLFYAFRIAPRTKGAEEADRNVDVSASTESPYFDLLDEYQAQSQLNNAGRAGAGNRAAGNEASGDGKQFFFDEAAMRRMGNAQKRRHDGEAGNWASKQHRGGQPITSSECWFCLGAPNVSKHLVVHVGEHNYLALPKGPLVDDHVLIIPIGHIASLVSASDEAVREIERYKTALRAMYAKEQQVAVFYERNYRSQHLQIQVVPMKQELSSSLKSALRDFGRSFAQRTRRAADESDAEFFVEVPRNTDLKQAFAANQAYFYVELPDGEKLVHRIDARQQSPFPVQFGREMLACSALLNTPNRVDWHACAQSVDEETAAAQRFREKFAPFDFADDDS